MIAVFIVWRSEIESTLEHARKSLGSDLKALAEAEATAAVAKAERGELTQAMGRLPANVTLSSELANRVQQRENDLRQAEGALLRARNAVANDRARIADLEQALLQLSAIAPAPVEAATAA